GGGSHAGMKPPVLSRIGGLPANPEALLELPGAFAVLVLEVAEQTTAAADHHQETATGMVILRLLIQVLGQIFDAPAEEGDLHLRRADVRGMGPVTADELALLIFGQGHGSFGWSLIPRREGQKEGGRLAQASPDYQGRIAPSGPSVAHLWNTIWGRIRGRGPAPTERSISAIATRPPSGPWRRQRPG